eukprot:5593481-Pyramimonas_sp.AAC.1
METQSVRTERASHGGRKSNKKHGMHTCSTFRADFVDLRWDPLAAPPAPSLARGSGADSRKPRGAYPLA